MNLRKTAIALAVAGTTVAAPTASFASADEIYASARVGVMHRTEPKNDGSGEDSSDFEVRSFSSRFGAKGETDLGNGLTGYGRYEWDVDFNNDSGEDDIGVRQRWVGLKGDFGSVQIGHGWWTFYNFAVGPNDHPWWHSGYAMISYRGRTDNAITYTGGSGNINFGVSAYFDDADTEEEDAPDQFEAGLSFGIGDMTLGFALLTSEAASIGNGVFDSSGDPEEVIGVSLSDIGIGPATLGVGFQAQDDDTALQIQLDVGNFYARVESESLDKDAIIEADGGGFGIREDQASNGSDDDRDRVGLTLGYTQSLGRKTTMYYEFWTIDEDTDDTDDNRDHIMAVLKYDII